MTNEGEDPLYVDDIRNTPMSHEARQAGADEGDADVWNSMRYAGFEVLNRLVECDIPEAKDISTRLASIKGVEEPLNADVADVVDQIDDEMFRTTSLERQFYLSRLSILGHAVNGISLAKSVNTRGNPQDMDLMISFARDLAEEAGLKLGDEVKSELNKIITEIK